MTAQLVFHQMVQNISFTPTKEERKKLYEKSIAAQKQSDDYKNNECPSDLISKISNTQVVTFGATVFATRQDLAFYKDADFCIFNTRNLPLIDGSMGSNCVPTNPVSINLFNTDESTTKDLLNKFMKWRSANELTIFKAYVASLEQYKKSETFEKCLASRGHPDLEITASDYINIVELFKKIIATLDEESDLASYGIKFKSFCQTWMKNGVCEKANFSVPSPHFQTVPFVDLSPFPVETIEEYTRLLRVQSHDMTTKIVNGSLEYEKSFVDLDDLYEKMNE